VIEKKERNGRTTTRVRVIMGEERTEEVARMLSGANRRLAQTCRADD
jgi:DNA repair ATPase RecN